MGDRIMQRRCAFTLIELLVVLAIIIALAALLVPVFASIRVRAGQSACSSNLRQLHKAFALYAADHDGFLPPYNNVIGSKRNGALWPETAARLAAALDPYNKSSDIWFCTSDIYARSASQEGHLDHRYGSYHFHMRSFQGKIPAPMDAVHFSGQNTFAASELPLLSDNLWDCKRNAWDQNASRYSHGGRHQAVFLDGHVETFRWEDGNRLDVVNGTIRGKGCVNRPD
jgi:prepilin-type processing-associated H-X9-DG protein